MFCWLYRRESTRKRQEQYDEEQDRGDEDDNNKEELGQCSHQAYTIKFRGLEQRNNPNDIAKWRHERTTFDESRCCEQTTTYYKGDIKLHGYFGFLHEGPWLHNNTKVSEKVELYDFKWSALREATRSFILYILIWPSTLHSLIETSSNIVPLL